MLPDQDMPQSYRACWEEQQVNQRAAGMRRLHHASNVKQEKRKLERPPLRLGLGIPLLLRNRQLIPDQLAQPVLGQLFGMRRLSDGRVV